MALILGPRLCDECFQVNPVTLKLAVLPQPSVELFEYCPCRVQIACLHVGLSLILNRFDNVRWSGRFGTGGAIISFH